MLKGINSRKKKTKFNYVPRFYDQKNQNLIHNRLGETRFANSYIQKKNKGNTAFNNDDRIKLSSYRNRTKASSSKSLVNIALLLVFTLVLVVLALILTSETFGVLYKR